MSGIIRRSDPLPLGAFPPKATNWCHSTSEVGKFNFEWTIHNFELRDPDYECAQLESAEFTCDNHHGNDLWKLCFHDEDGIKIGNRLLGKARRILRRVVRWDRVQQ